MNSLIRSVADFYFYQIEFPVKLLMGAIRSGVSLVASYSFYDSA